MMIPCDTKNCVRILGHSGCHTAAPSARTLDWDLEKRANDVRHLDFPSPLSDATKAFQTLLEGHRANPDDDELFEDLCKARAEIEIEWLKRL